MKKIYMDSKALLNGVYGMCATYPIHTKHVYNQSEEQQFYTEKSVSFDIDKYIKNMFLPYTRQHLFKIFDIIGHDNIIYSDTDSAFYLSTPDIEKSIENFNHELQEQSKSSNPGIYNGDIIRFKFLHEKQLVVMLSIIKQRED